MPESEKRKTERVPIELPLRYWLLKGSKNSTKKNSSEIIQGTSRDISDSGICIKTGSFPVASSVKEGKDLVGLEIDLFPHFKNIKAYGKPRWWNDVSVNEKANFLIGVEFVESKEGNHKVLQRYLKNSFAERLSHKP